MQLTQDVTLEDESIEYIEQDVEYQREQNELIVRCILDTNARPGRSWLTVMNSISDEW